MALEYVGAGAPTAWANVTSGTADNFQNVAVPAGVEDGDILLLIVGSYGTGANTATVAVATGTWTVHADDQSTGAFTTGASDNMRLWCQSHVASSEPATYSVNFKRQGGSHFDNRGWLIAYRNVDGDFSKVGPTYSDRADNVGSVNLEIDAETNSVGDDPQALVTIVWGGCLPTGSDVVYTAPADNDLDVAFDWDTTTGGNKNIRVYSETWEDTDDYPARTIVCDGTESGGPNTDDIANSAIRLIQLVFPEDTEGDMWGWGEEGDAWAYAA